MNDDERFEHLHNAFQFLEGRCWATEVILSMSLKGQTPTRESVRARIHKEWPGLKAAGEVVEHTNRGIDSAISHLLCGETHPPRRLGKIGYV